MTTTSLAKIEANKKNAEKSTGPKDTSLTRLNALKHGLLTKKLIIKGEQKRDLEELGRRLRADLSPQGELEMILVDRIISSVWRLRRAIRVERDFLQADYEECKYDYDGHERTDNKAWNTVVVRQLGHHSTWLNLTRYESAIEKQIYKALHELQRLQSARKGEKPPAPIAIDVDLGRDA